jgi:hypothetical protein
MTINIIKLTQAVIDNPRGQVTVSMAQKLLDRITELEEEQLTLVEKTEHLESALHAKLIADETGYVDGVGFIEDFFAIDEYAQNLLDAHNLEQQAKGAISITNSVLRKRKVVVPKVSYTKAEYFKAGITALAYAIEAEAKALREKVSE